MATEADFEVKKYLFPADEDVFESSRPPRQFDQAAPVLQVILVVFKATSGAALTGVANPKATPEVAQTKSF